METALAIVNLFNAAAPGIANLILLIRNKDGSITVAQMLDQADSKFDANIKEASDWFKTHPQAQQG
jgi:hypothetical protein